MVAQKVETERPATSDVTKDLPRMERPSVIAATRHVLQRQTTRLGLTSDDSVPSAVLAQSLDDCLDEFLRQFVFPLAAVALIVFTFVEISATTWFADKVFGATVLIAATILSTAVTIRCSR